MLVERRVKFVHEQHIIDKPSPVKDFPMRTWTLKCYLLDEEGNERPADVFTKIVYHLHPSFEDPVQTFTKAPFACTNEGWGEFEIMIDIYTTEKTKITPAIVHDLGFGAERVENIQTVTIKNPSQALQERLRETGPLPTDESKKKGSGLGGVGKKSGRDKYDYEKIAEALEQLDEEDLLRVIQLINENKGPDTYIRSDVEAGEFSIDLYTMGDPLSGLIWEHLSKKNLIR